MELFNIDYNKHVTLVGTVHFTRRSVNEAYETVKSLNPGDVALELDLKRFQLLNNVCLACGRRGSCRGLCEFTGAADALGSVDANIWLIDMTENEMRRRIHLQTVPTAKSGVRDVFWWFRKPQWTMRPSRRNSRFLSEASALHRVLVDERNTLMAARLAWIASKNLEKHKKTKILSFVGAAHVEGISRLLEDPVRIKENLRECGIPFTEPTLIRRVEVRAG